MLRQIVRSGLPLVLAAGVGFTAHAQPADAGATDEAATDEAATDEVKAAEPVPQPSTPEVPAEEAVKTVPDSQKAPQSSAHLARMREILSRVLKHLEDAREERDVVKLNCVNEKLTAIKGLLRISEQADVAMQEALARRNAEAGEHEYEKIAIAVTKCEQLFAESEACVGELAVYAGDTEVEVEIEGEPPTDISEDLPTIDIERPPAASPFQ